MRVFLDTNVLASAATTRGLCADVLRETLARHELIICEQVLDELERVLRSKFGIRQELFEDFIGLLQQDAIPATPDRTLDIKLRDKADLSILAAAVAGDADVFITGDKELLSLAHSGNLRIISPRRFWEESKTRRPPRDARGRQRRGKD